MRLQELVSCVLFGGASVGYAYCATHLVFARENFLAAVCIGLCSICAVAAIQCLRSGRACE